MPWDEDDRLHRLPATFRPLSPRGLRMPRPTLKLTFSVESKTGLSPEQGRARADILPRVYQISYVTPRCLGTTPIHSNTVAWLL